MLTKEDNEILTQVGPGTPMGELMRRYWVPVVLSRRAGSRRPDQAGAGAGREHGGFPDRPGRSWAAGRVLLTSARVALFRPRGEGRPSLLLSRLEVRAGRALPGHAQRGPRNRLQARREASRLPLPRARRAGMGVHGRSGPAYRAAGLRMAGLTGQPAVHLEVLPAQ